MRTVTDALLWSGSGATLSLFLITKSELVPRLELSWKEYRPTRVRTYSLEDAAGLLGGRRVIEYDAVFDTLPPDLDRYLTSCLCEAMSHGAEAAWFGFEGSFDFEYLLAPEIAPQIYALADSAGVAVAVEGDVLGSDAWRERVGEARNRIM
jgi:hypothetical protein